MGFFRRLSHFVTKSPARVPLIQYRHLSLSPLDVFLASYPRSGNTWLRFDLFEIMSGNPADFIHIEEGMPEIGKQHNSRLRIPGGGRLIKTHESFRHDYLRAIYLVWDPRAVVLSEFSFQKMIGIYLGPLGSFVHDFLNGKVHGYGFWGAHVNSWLDGCEHGSVIMEMIKFEELHLNTLQIMERICNFLNLDSDINTMRKAIDENS